MPTLIYICITDTSPQDGKNLGQPSILKMVDQADLGQYVTYPIDIVKFKKGQTPDPEDNNALWNITYDPTDPQPSWMGNMMEDFDASFSYNQDKCVWTDQCLTSPVPSVSPSNKPSSSLSSSAQPSDEPSVAPSDEPSVIASTPPSDEPSVTPSDEPSVIASTAPSDESSTIPSASPSNEPSTIPSSSASPTDDPISPSSSPSVEPSSNPSLSASPSEEPSLIPSASPSHEPSGSPSTSPSLIPSLSPSRVPSSFPSTSPSVIPSTMPSQCTSDGQCDNGGCCVEGSCISDTANQCVLKFLYDATRGDSWVVNSGWQFTTISDPCGSDPVWYGITCNPSLYGGNITEIDLGESETL